jgi:WD40 repeat protein
LVNWLAAGHSGPVNDVAFSPDGRRLASVGDDGVVKIWNTTTGGELLTLPHSSAGLPVYSVAFSPSGDRLATAGFDQIAKIWDAQTGQELLTLVGHQDWVVGVAFSPEVAPNSGAMIATGSQDGTAKIWNAATGQLLLTLAPATAGAAVNRLAFNPTGSRLATASDDGSITLWDTTSGQAVTILTGHNGPVYAVAFNPTGDQLATASIDGTIKIWASDSGRELNTLRHNRAGWATSVAFSPTGGWLASAGEDGRVVIWDAVSGRERLTLTGHTGAVKGLAISAAGNAGTGEMLASAGADGQVRTWQITGSKAVPALPPLANHRGPVYGLALNPTKKWLATSGAEGAIKIWQIAPDKSRLVTTLTPATGTIYAVAFSPDGNNLATAGEDGLVTVWQTTSPAFSKGGNEARLRLTGHTGPVYALAFNPGGSQLASAGMDGLTRLWDVATGEEGPILTLSDEDAGPIYALAFNPAGNRLATAGRDGLVRLWDATSGQPIDSLPGVGWPVRALIFSPALSGDSSAEEAGDLLAIGGEDGVVRLWAEDQPLRILPGAGAAIQALAFSPDNTRLAATAADGTVTVWSLVSGRELLRLASPPGLMAGFGLVFLPDGAALVTGSQSAPSGEAGAPTETTGGAALRWNVGADELLNLYSPAPIKSMALAGPFENTKAASINNRLAIAGEDGVVRLWQIEPETGRWSATPAGNQNEVVGALPVDERTALSSITMADNYLATGDEAGSVWLWAIESGELLHRLAAHTGTVNSLVLTSSLAGTKESRLITAGQDDTIKVWTISPTGVVDDWPQLTLAGHTGDVVAVAVSPTSAEDDNDLLASASHDGTARLWDLQESGRKVRTLRGHTGWLHHLAFNARGDRLATVGEDGTVRVWEVASGRELLRLDFPEGREEPVKQVAFGPSENGDGVRLAALAENGAIGVWTLTTEPNKGTLSAQPLLQLAPSMAGQPNSLAFDSIGRALVTAGDDGVVRFYALEVEDLLNLR